MLGMRYCMRKTNTHIKIVRISEGCPQNGDRVSKNNVSCHICIRWPKSVLVRYEKYGTISIYYIYFCSVYEVCAAETFSPSLGVCKQYPSFQECGCPLKAGEVSLKDIEYPLPALGALAAVVTVNIFFCFSLRFNPQISIRGRWLLGPI